MLKQDKPSDIMISAKYNAMVGITQSKVIDVYDCCFEMCVLHFLHEAFVPQQISMQLQLELHLL